MPLIQTSELPAFSRLKSEGTPVLTLDQAAHQDIRPLHIGILNLMPDAAVEATERQYLRLIGESNRVAQIEIHPFTLPIIPRGDTAQAHFDAHYKTFDQIKSEGLDGLIVTGASEETNPHVSSPFWNPLKDILEWAQENVTSTLCSCFASHAALTHLHGETPEWRTKKRWGVYSHKITAPDHPLVHGMNTKFDAPHSRYSEISRKQFEKAGFHVLAESKDAGVHIATSRDGLRLVCLQGHPEYDTQSLLKEYIRETKNYATRTRDDYPPLPEHYFSKGARKIANDFRDAVETVQTDEPFPEEHVTQLLDNTWADSARSFFATWVGVVYQTTGYDRKQQFMNGIDSKNPLGLAL